MSGAMGDIGSLGMGTAGSGNNGTAQPGGQFGKNYKLVGIIIAAIIAIIILVVVIFSITGAVKKSKVKAALMVWEEDLDDIEWEKYYPEDVAESWEDYVDDLSKSSRDAWFEDIEIVSIVKLKGSEAMEVMEEAVKNVFEYRGEKFRAKNNKISEGYVVVFYSKVNRDIMLSHTLIIKVDGVYGRYW